jgi:hypothetical protein
MRQVGSRRPPLLSALPTADALRAAATHQRTGTALSALSTTGIPKGVYRFASHAEMNLHTDEALARAVAMNGRLRASSSA